MAERYSCTILQKARALILEFGLSPKFWGEVVLHSSQFINVSQKRANGSNKLIEMFFGLVPVVSKLRVIGWSASTHTSFGKTLVEVVK